MIENNRRLKAGVGDSRAGSSIFQVSVAFFFDFITSNVLLGNGLGGGCKFGMSCILECGSSAGLLTQVPRNHVAAWYSRLD